MALPYPAPSVLIVIFILHQKILQLFTIRLSACVTENIKGTHIPEFCIFYKEFRIIYSIFVSVCIRVMRKI
jgi:hypothetical protein